MSSVGLATPVDPAVVLTWRAEVKRAVRSSRELCRRLDLPISLADSSAAACNDFPVFVPEPFLARIRPSDLNDPLLRQVLPVEAETTVADKFSLDPVGDLAAQTSPGVIRKYDRRVLLMVSGSCAVHCRYCFRRHFPYQDVPHDIEYWHSTLRELADQPEVTELILSGGDPLTLTDLQLEALLEGTHSMPHVRRVRIHTRLPILIPARITPRLIRSLSRLPATPVLVLHVNHAQELNDEVEQSLRPLLEAGVVLLNQSVLLRGVNDSVEVLESLSEKLVQTRVLPYYLHQLDRVQGAAHFFVPEEEGCAIVQQLQARLPGYAVPRYVRDEPGMPCKTVLA